MKILTKSAYILWKKYFNFILSILMGIFLFEYSCQMHQDYSGADNLLFMLALCMGNGMSGWNGIVFPILAALPSAITYVRDYKTGFLHLKFLKQSKQKYILKLLLENGILGGLSLAIPLVFFVFHLSYSKKYEAPLITEHGLTVVNFMTEFATKNQNGYIGMLMGIVFVCGIIFSTFSLGISVWVKNEFLTILLPFAFCIFNAMITPSFAWDFLLLYSPNGYTNISVWNLVIMGSLLFIVGIILFIIGIIYNERVYNGEN